MLYSQALTGGHQAAPSSSSSSTTPSTTRTHPPDTTTTTAGTPKETTTNKQQHHNQTKNPDHTPNTPPTTPQSQVYVLTLTTTPSLTNPLTALRKTHFPRHRDRGNLPAHLTLFHALPGSEMERHIAPALEELCCCGGDSDQQKQKALPLATGAAFRMRQGVGIRVAGAGAPGPGRLHAELQRRWWAFLSEQDRRPWRPHWTVQNKAADEAAVDAAMEDVLTRFRGAEGLATGCTLWRYEKGGRWTFERSFAFGGEK